MNKIDISSWGEFKVSDLFDIHPTKHYNDTNGKALANSKLFDVDGNNPVVVNSAFNNGIGGYSNKECNEKGGIITFSDTTTTDAIFYQENDFIGYSHIQGMYPKKYQDKWSKYSMKFFEVSFHSRANTLGYNYVNKFTRDLANNMSIKLPIDKNGEPDWNYMESYMKHIEKLSQDKLSSLIQILQGGGGESKLEIKQWKEFKIEELFEIKRPTARSIQDYEDGIVPFIASGNYNNGIIKYCTLKDNEILDKGNCITVSPIDASSFYQDKDFLGRGGAGSAIILLYNKNLNLNSGLFISSIIRNKFTKYSYNNQLSSSSIISETIKLPSTINGEPDWNYMNEYITYIKMKAMIILNSVNNIRV